MPLNQVTENMPQDEAVGAGAVDAGAADARAADARAVDAMVMNTGAVDAGAADATAVDAARRVIEDGRAAIGIELGSTRIKAVLIDENHAPIAAGNSDWENRLEHGYWTYSLDDVWAGLRNCFSALARDVESRYGVCLKSARALGVSAMMHGYLAFDGDMNLLAPFRTWRNTTTEKAAAKLTGLFGFNIPMRWSVAHLYQAILNGEEHLARIARITTLSGYVHQMLTGRGVLGVGDASGMFPIDSATNDYNVAMADKFDELVVESGYNFTIRGLLPEVLAAGDDAGVLTERGARMLDPEGGLAAGIPMCPPEGDGPTGMAATNSVAPATGNISAGTSIFAMAVLDGGLSNVYPEIDMITTPDGKPVAMVHCNNGTSDLDAWARLFAEAGALSGNTPDKDALYNALYSAALNGEPDCGGILSYNYVAGEHMTGFEHGRPLLTRTPDAHFTLPNFMRAQLFAAMAGLKLGMDILTEREHIRLALLTGHGGLFKTKTAGQRLMAAALSTPIAVMESAGEGGAWGMAILAAYRAYISEAETAAGACVPADDRNISLAKYLADRVFNSAAASILEPDAVDVEGFSVYMERYVEGLAIERAAVEHLR